MGPCKQRYQRHARSPHLVQGPADVVEEDEGDKGGLHAETKGAEQRLGRPHQREEAEVGQDVELADHQVLQRVVKLPVTCTPNVISVGQMCMDDG